MNDFVEDIEESLDIFLLVEQDLSLTSSKLSGKDPAKMSIPVLFE